ncbi:MAG: hypothetical protein J7K12_01360, partial [Thermoplasmata archaeon]|nr:hypothetical protein [Thermoplasmata archaeon]
HDIAYDYYHNYDEELWKEMKNVVKEHVDMPLYVEKADRKVVAYDVIVLESKEDNLSIKITKPENAVYIFDRAILPANKPIIIGRITVEAIVYPQASKVEFYIDDELKYEDESPPYQWQWNAASIGKHEIKVIAYNGKNKAEDKKDVFKIGI